MLIWNYRKAEKLFRIFLAFLLFGFLTDAASWGLYLLKKIDWIIALRHPYTLIEVGVFTYVNIQCFPGEKKLLRLIYPWVLGLLLLSWLWAATFLDLGFYKISVGAFESFWSLAIAFSSAFVALKMVEKLREPVSNSRLWVVFGIFFYSFSTFFISSFLETELGTSIYALHNMINVFTNIIFTVGFYFLSGSQDQA